jgi:FkbH-like protein
LRAPSKTYATEWQSAKVLQRMKTETPSSSQPLEFALISSFNLSNLGALLSKGEELPMLRTVSAPYGQVIQTLLQPTIEVWSECVSGAVIWTTPEAISLEYRKLLANEDATPDALMRDVDEFCAAIKKIPHRVKYVFVPTWVAGAFEGRLGLLDMDARRGVSLALMRMNLRLVDNLLEDARVTVLDAARWMAVHGEKSLSPRLWYMSKTPYSVDLFKEASAEIKAAMRALTGQTKKLIVLDLDDTLWGGIVGEVGWENVRLGGHDAIGEAFRDFQLALKSLQQRGILLGIVSKNEESTALEAIRSNQEMVLRLDDFVGWRINWRDKAENISELVSELNLGLQSVVFIDDNPVERDRVRRALGEVLVPDWPPTPLEFKSTLQRLRCFDQAQISAEDRERSGMYAIERKRKEAFANVGSVDVWLQTLETRVLVESLNRANLERVTQLLNKTNQMNLSTRRMKKEEIWDWAHQPENTFLAFRVVDKYGDYGLVGIGSLSLKAGAEATVTDFILSCRVMGRKVEETMLHALSTSAKSGGAAKLSARYFPTSKNRPCLQFLENAGLKRSGDNKLFTLDLAEAYPKPAAISLELTTEVQTSGPAQVTPATC